MGRMFAILFDWATLHRAPCFCFLGNVPAWRIVVMVLVTVVVVMVVAVVGVPRRSKLPKRYTASSDAAQASTKRPSF